MKKDIKIKFVDFWGNFDVKDNFIFKRLSASYNVILSNKPDYLFFSAFGWEHLEYDCIKIFYTGENITPDFGIADYAIGFDYLDFQDRYLRVPLSVIHDSYGSLLRQKEIDRETALNRKFCSFVYSNNVFADTKRSDLFDILTKYKRVDSGGKLYNNVGGKVPDKLAFIKNYKFNIAFENSCLNGYTTEKIVDPMVVNSLPIYWGNPSIDHDFNSESFINASDFGTLEELADYIKFLDTHDDAYIEKLSKPWLKEEHIYDWEGKVSAFLANIVEQPLDKAIRTPKYGYTAIRKRNFIELVFIQKTVTKYKFIFKYLNKLKKHF